MGLRKKHGKLRKRHGQFVDNVENWLDLEYGESDEDLLQRSGRIRQGIGALQTEISNRTEERMRFSTFCKQLERFLKDDKEPKEVVQRLKLLIKKYKKGTQKPMQLRQRHPSVFDKDR